MHIATKFLLLHRNGLVAIVCIVLGLVWSIIPIRSRESSRNAVRRSYHSVPVNPLPPRAGDQGHSPRGAYSHEYMSVIDSMNVETIIKT